MADPRKKYQKTDRCPCRTGTAAGNDHYCPYDLASEDEKLNQCDNCNQWKKEYQDFLCKDCFDLLQPEKEYGTSYGFAKDI